MKISYAITTWIEHEELNQLLSFLKPRIDDDDEIVIVYDKNRVTPEVLYVMKSFDRPNYKYYPFDFHDNWLENKNYLGSKCSGEYIFQIDADEIPSEFLIENIKSIIELNQVDVIIVPRINLVKGLSNDHIQKWRWVVNEKGWVNFPDPQKRIYKNHPDIQWRDPEGHPQIHGMVTGYKSITQLPFEEEFCLTHNKTIQKQEYQNKTYNDVLSGKGRED
jgi:hypothetical protein